MSFKQKWLLFWTQPWCYLEPFPSDRVLSWYNDLPCHWPGRYKTQPWQQMADSHTLTLSDSTMIWSRLAYKLWKQQFYEAWPKISRDWSISKSELQIWGKRCQLWICRILIISSDCSTLSHKYMVFVRPTGMLTLRQDSVTEGWMGHKNTHRFCKACEKLL